ncbi:MAG: hypothetical protein ACXVUL_13065 [Solirubrobacteraceae bacterium]
MSTLLGYGAKHLVDRMTLARALRRLRRRPIAVLIAFVFACAVGAALYSSNSKVGVASASALVDSSKSQVADLGDSSGASVGALAYRASLLASLMTNPPIVNQIAKAAGLTPAELTATGPSPVAGPSGALPATAAPAAGSGPNASTLTASVPTLPAGQLPVIQINTEAPTPALAGKLANAGFTALQAQINSVAGTNDISVPQRVVIRELGPATASWSSQGPGTLLAGVGAIFAFILACSAILAVASLRAALREEAARERGPQGATDPVADVAAEPAHDMPDSLYPDDDLEHGIPVPPTHGDLGRGLPVSSRLSDLTADVSASAPLSDIAKDVRTAPHEASRPGDRQGVGSRFERMSS